MKNISICDLQWQEWERNPLIYPTFPSHIIADPTFLPPDQTPDHIWHLFAHSLKGLHHFISSDRLNWYSQDRVIINRGIRPFIFKYENVYHLFYERILRLYPMISRIEVITSDDLICWSNPHVVIDPTLDWHFSKCLFSINRAATVGNPCIILDDDGFRLYYSAGLVFLRDCLFFEPKFIGIALSQSLLGPYTPCLTPIITPEINERFAIIGAGSIKVIKIKEKYYGFQNKIFWDYANKHSGSAIWIRESQDGKTWLTDNSEPLIFPDNGWKRSHVYACDIRFANNQWHLFFNARNGWFLGKEAIGYAFANTF